MEQIAYILVGWLLGLLSPAIVEKINSQYSKEQFFKATCTEIHDLQYRIAIVCFILAKKYGTIDIEFLQWIKPIVENYKGNESNESTVTLVNSMLTVEEQEFNLMVQHMRAEPNSGLNLKLFSASFLETNLALVSKLPMDLQIKIHEFRNHLNTLNQEIIEVNDKSKLTFDSSISDVNQEIISNDILAKYIFIQGMCRRVVDKLGLVVSSTV